MSGDINFAIDAVTKSGNHMSDTAEQLQGKLDAFTQTLEGFGNPFGGDDIGSTMQEVYDAIREAATESFSDSAETIADTGGELVGMAETYTEIDRANEDMFRQVMEELGR